MNKPLKLYYHCKLQKITMTILFLTIFLNYTNFILAANKKSQTFSAPILKYMKSFNDGDFLLVNNVTDFTSIVPKGSKISNNCQYGLFTVNQYGYIGNSRYPWNLLPDTQLSKKHKYDITFPAEYYLDCGKHDSRNSTDNLIEIRKFIINKDESLVIYRNEIKN